LQRKSDTVARCRGRLIFVDTCDEAEATRIGSTPRTAYSSNGFADSVAMGSKASFIVLHPNDQIQNMPQNTSRAGVMALLASMMQRHAAALELDYESTALGLGRRVGLHPMAAKLTAMAAWRLPKPTEMNEEPGLRRIPRALRRHPSSTVFWMQRASSGEGLGRRLR
jgi:hypothetical protein